MLILIKKSQLAASPDQQRISRFTPGMRVDACITELSKETRKVQLSIRKLEEQETAQAVKLYGSKFSGEQLSSILKIKKALDPLLKKKKPEGKKK